MTENNQEIKKNTTNHHEFGPNERLIISILSIVGGILVLINSLLGPLWLDLIQMHTSISGILQTKAQDLVNIIIITPLLIIGGILNIKKSSIAKYLLILTPIYLFYFGLSYGIGQEWTVYPGNIENFFWIYILCIVIGLILLFYTMPQFKSDDAPKFNKKSLRWYVIISIIFLGLFTLLWYKDIFTVLFKGDLPGNAYTNGPTLFWMIRYLDLSITIPLGFVGFYLLWTRPKKYYAVLLLFFGFFLTMIFAVCSMAWFQFVTNDPEFQINNLFLFNGLAIIVLIGFYYLFHRKIIKSSKIEK
jgi:hypothetical protein